MTVGDGYIIGTSRHVVDFLITTFLCEIIWTTPSVAVRHLCSGLVDFGSTSALTFALDIGY